MRATLRRAAAAAFCAQLLAGIGVAQTTSFNSKVFFTPYGAQTGRQTANQVDTLYMMPDRDFRIGKGTVSGFETVLQDQEQATSERVEFAIVKSLGQEKPDTSSSGELLKFAVTLFGTNQGTAAYRYTITPPTPATNIPGDAGIRLVLPMPRNGTLDMCTVRYRPGNTLKMTPKAPARTYAHYLTSTGAAQWLSARSTMHAGFLFGEPITKFTVRTAKSAYGSEQTIVGPESIHIDGTRGDKGGWSFVADGFKPGTKEGCYAIPMVGVTAKTPLATLWGELHIDFATLAILDPIVLDKQGTASTGFVPIPANLQFATQALFLKVDQSDPDPNKWKVTSVQLSDASALQSF